MLWRFKNYFNNIFKQNSNKAFLNQTAFYKTKQNFMQSRQKFKKKMYFLNSN